MRSRIEAEAGEAAAAVRSFREARQLNPNSGAIASANSVAEQQIAADQPLSEPVAGP